MKRNRSTGQNVIILTVGAFIGALAYAIRGLIVARVVGPEGYGDFVLAIILASTFMYGFMLGMDVIIPRELAQTPSSLAVLLPSVFIPAVIWSVLLVFLIYGLGYLFQYSREVLILLLFTGPIVAIQALTSLIRSVYRGMERMELDTYSRIVEGVLGLVLVGSIALLTASILSSTIAFFVSVVLAFLVFLWWALRLISGRISFDRSLFKRILYASLPLGIAVIVAQSGQSISTLTLGKLASSQDVGFYGAALGCAMMLRPLHLAYSSAFLPRLSAQALFSIDKPLAAHESGLRYALVISLPVGVATLMLAPFLIRLFYGEQYIEGVQALRILGLAGIFLFINTYFWQVFAALGSAKAVLNISIASILVALILALLLIPTFGTMGAAMAELSREAIQLFLFILLLHRRWHTFSISWHDALAMIGASLIMAACLWGVRFSTGWIVLPVAAFAFMVYGVVLLWWGVIKRNEIKQLIPNSLGAWLQGLRARPE